MLSSQHVQHSGRCQAFNGSCKRIQCLHRRTVRAHSTRPGSRPHTTLVEAPSEEQTQESATPFGQLVDFFLNRASSSLKRGPATCLTCKGKGSCMCPVCQGAGITDKHPHLDPVRHTAQKLKQVIGVDRSNYKTEWQLSNRCRCCRGGGLVLCPDCGGLGIRSPSTKTPQQ